MNSETRIRFAVTAVGVMVLLVGLLVGVSVGQNVATHRALDDIRQSQADLEDRGVMIEVRVAGLETDLEHIDSHFQAPEPTPAVFPTYVLTPVATP
jgi:hypothetical protein